MKILYLGNIIEASDCTRYLGPSVAGNKMQVGMLKGIRKIHKKLDVITEVPIATYPRERKIFISNRTIKIETDIIAKSVPFINIFFLKQITTIFCAVVLLIKWAIKNRNEKKVIITFNAFPCISTPAILISKVFTVEKFCILADPPIDVTKRNLVFRTAKWLEQKLTQRNIRKYDGIIALNKKAIEKYAPDVEYVLVDGGFDEKDIPQGTVGGQWGGYEKGDIVELVFSGGLYEYNGLINLIEGFKLIKESQIRLNIYGEGPLKEYIVKETETDDRIKFHGNIPNSEILKIQQNAALLINPRPVNEPMSLYTFPSKMIEYMLSGTPVITTKLNGLTEEYLARVFLFESDSSKDIAAGIESVLMTDKDELIKKATQAKYFIIENKTWDKQSNNIYEFISNKVAGIKL